MDTEQFQLLLQRLEKETKSLLDTQETIYKLILGKQAHLPSFVVASMLTTTAKLKENIQEQASKRITDGTINDN